MQLRFLKYTKKTRKADLSSTQFYVAKLSAGFTLVELLIVLTIIGLLVAVFLPNITDALKRARLAQNQGFAGNIDPIIALGNHSVPLDIRTQQVSGVVNGQVVGNYVTPPFGLSILAGAGGSTSTTWSSDIPIPGGMSINIPGTQSFNMTAQSFTTTQDQLSIAMWVKPTSTNSAYTWTIKSGVYDIFSFDHSNTTGMHFIFYSHPCVPTTPTCTVQSQSVSAPSATSTLSNSNLLDHLKLNEWNHVLVTFKPAVVHVWVNNKKVLNYALPINTSIVDPAVDGNPPFLNISATNVKLYNLLFWQEFFDPQNPGQS